MVTVKLFGLFRLDTGLKEIKAEASSVKELYPILLDEAKKVNPTTMITAADIDGCIVVINGKQSKKNSKLRDGDTVFLMSPVCGG
ncbi:MAG: MoaD/ThiS family protein [Lachnospiraceae bacterium]|nr:MoaD/ThiS family protein [Lachnospiraceae bacterium]MBR3262520.1 MoaD/ThiS family protein [Lachnospiraceae bacterium]